MRNRILWVLLALMAIMIGLYPIMYFFVDKNFGLLSTKSNEILSNFAWNAGFYTHIMLGGLALLIGWFQFNDKLRTRNPKLHRTIGKVYVVSVLLSAIAGFCIAFFATGGIIASLGFIGLALIWFYTTMDALWSIRKGKVERHQKMMIYSYAACFAAVTLRIWLPLLSAYFGDFETAYLIVAWLCWVPNMIIAHMIVGKISLLKKVDSQNVMD
ncbi:MAG: DUF2306 domain-containing protein [Saprospiraceae bacterium]|nr:DUF2306 domain-containing protein [Saprospiraceae bacterium]